MLLVVGWILLLLALLIVFLVCKLPGVGPLLYAIAYPVAAIAAGAIFAGMGYVGYPLAAPAIWQGNTTLQTAARLLQIGRRQLLGVIVRMFGLLLLVGVLSAIVFGILGTGAAIASSISAATGTSPLGGLMGTLGGRAASAGTPAPTALARMRREADSTTAAWPIWARTASATACCSRSVS